MTHQLKVHLQFGSTLTLCGKNVKPDWMTDELDQVTCRSCNRDAPRTRQLSESQVAARKLDSFGDSNYPGRGHLKCIICRRPYIQHPIRFCEYEETDA